MNPDRSSLHSGPSAGSPPGARRSRVWAVATVAVLCTACSLDKAAAPDNGGGIHLPMATAQAIADFVPSLSDAQTRVLPALADAASVNQLNAELAQIAAALSRGDQVTAEKQIALARATLDGYPTNSRTYDAVELSVIGIVIDRAAQLDGLPALPNRRAP